MSEKLEQEGATENVTPQYNEVEQAAIEKGWKPKEDYSGDPSRWRSAETFLALEEPIKRIEQQSKEVKQLRQALEAFQQHHSKVAQTEYDRALRSLEVKRRTAMVEGEHEMAFQIEDQINQVKEEKAAIPEVKIPEPSPELPAEFVRWNERNDWYGKNEAMTGAADALGARLKRQGYAPSEVLQEVEKQMREEFPQKFEKKAQRAANAEAPTRGGQRRDVEYALDETETAIMRKITTGPNAVMTREQYIKELKKSKGEA